MTKRDYYEILGVNRDAGQDEIKRAYRKLAFKYHPDRNPNDGAEARFKELTEAYEVLSDTNRRTNYDRFGFSETGAEDIFGRGFEGFGFGGLGDIFETFFGGMGQTGRRGPVRGSDLQYSLSLTFEEASLGTEKEVEVYRIEYCSQCNGKKSKKGKDPEKCPECEGTGQVYQVKRSIFGQFTNVTSCTRCRGEGVIISSPCPNCQGTGREKFKRKLLAKVPAGVHNGLRIRLSSEGNVGERNGPAGDVYLNLQVEPHEYFKREGDDVLYELPINFAQAALGAELEVSTLYGKEKIKIPSGSQSGTEVRFRGKGITHLGRMGKGDHVVRIRVVTPEKLSKQQKQIFRDLAESFKDSNTK
jgi:molecular chaperone DnaJ